MRCTTRAQTHVQAHANADSCERLSNYCVSRIAGLVEGTKEKIDVISLPLFLSRTLIVRKSAYEEGMDGPWLHPLFDPLESTLCTVAPHYCMQLGWHEESQQETSSVRWWSPMEGMHRRRGNACRKGAMHFARWGTATFDRRRHLYATFGAGFRRTFWSCFFFLNVLWWLSIMLRCVLTAVSEEIEVIWLREMLVIGFFEGLSSVFCCALRNLSFLLFFITIVQSSIVQ